MMDKESSKIILKWNEESELQEHFEELVFKLKNEVLLAQIHPLIFKNKLNKFQKQINAFHFLTGQNLEKYSFNKELSFNGAFIESYNSFEQLKSGYKMKILSEQNPQALYLLFQEYLHLHRAWWVFVSKIPIAESEKIKESEKVNPMDLYSQINEWSNSNYDVSLLEKSNFATLRYEILRAKTFIKKYE